MVSTRLRQIRPPAIPKAIRIPVLLEDLGCTIRTCPEVVDWDFNGQTAGWTVLQIRLIPDSGQ